MTVCWLATTSTLAAAAASISDVALWDYRDTAPSEVTLPNYHAWLLQWCKDNPPTRLVLYVSSPCVGDSFASFYDPTAAPTSGSIPTTFVDFLADLATASPTVEVELMMDRSAFPEGGASTPCWSGVASSHPSLPLPTAWSNLPLALDWVGDLLANPALASGPLRGITLDPELGTSTPGSTCVAIGNHATSISYQQVIDWVDAWKYANGHTTFRAGMTFEVDSPTFTKLNVSDFPMSSELAGLVAAGSPELTCRLSSGTPNWRPGTTAPLLQTAYMQVYVACGSGPQGITQAGSFWRWQTEDGCETGAAPTPRSATEAADALRLNMTQSPGSLGPGTLMAAAAGGTVTWTGVDTLFTEWPEYTRVAAVQSDGSTIPSAAEGGKWTFQTATSDTAATGYGPQVGTSGAQLPYRYSELLMNWQVPYITSAMTQRVWPMFSAEKDTLLPFFGYWTEQEFLAFLDAFAAATDGSDADHAIYMSDASTPLAAPPNWGLYDLRQICDSWGVATYPSSSSGQCPGDYNFSGSVDVTDLLHLLQYWGTSGADLNSDGQTNAVDLGTLLGNFGEANC